MHQKKKIALEIATKIYFKCKWVIDGRMESVSSIYTQGRIARRDNWGGGGVYSYIRDACDVTLSVYPHRASLKNMPDHGGNGTYDLWNASTMLCQLSNAVWSVRLRDISDINVI